jgi:hypothetical protein
MGLNVTEDTLLKVEIFIVILVNEYGMVRQVVRV